jgi:lysozyme family protein
MNFDQAFLHLLGIEKGFSNNKADKGGATNWGITIKVLGQWRGKSVTVEDVRGLSMNEAKQIYKAWYWDPIGGDHLKHYSMAYALFDQAVNRGVSTVVKQAQKIIGVPADGVMGPKTIEALNLYSEKVFLDEFIDAARRSYASIVQADPSQAIFKNGWENRVRALETYLSTVTGKIVLGTGTVILAGIIFFLIFSNSSPNRRAA